MSFDGYTSLNTLDMNCTVCSRMPTRQVEKIDKWYVYVCIPTTSMVWKILGPTWQNRTCHFRVSFHVSGSELTFWLESPDMVFQLLLSSTF